jgi:hypothetical protein
LIFGAKSCAYSLLVPPLADPIRFSGLIRQLCENLSFVLKLRNRETFEKENSLQSFNL